MLSVVFSLKDPVGVRASEILINLINAKPAACPAASICYKAENAVIAGFDVDQTEFEFLDKTPEPSADAAIVLSRHESESGKKSLTVHFTGNPTAKALFGGRPAELSFAPAHLAKPLLQRYYYHARELGLLEAYAISLEATHHGPTTNRKPLAFIEIGSTAKEWNDELALKAMANAVADVLQSSNAIQGCSPVLGLGSTHYPARFTELELSSEVCMGHILSKHVLGELAPGALRQAVEKSLPNGARSALIEKKGASSSVRKALIDELNSMNVKVQLI
ncbi:hypothetical protein ASAC_1030 [Acidilobus saccharovorans 345-15]|uniref:D-aminoacyl-tRNA deacylase n=1 Tax=Acidilobus saccharovorans (strain DSM 16705 / JCM 18335 / VKM B-2471 / 345-15) TaxID=666510 RepID=D9Q297_ACIS3|nr:D-aminoacyl-tRNA deacylase [Acidilobus saccharovorans]ADL19435.1 hypothetical protein ASAC_1030 [Acidilobus saccharovorans 345-15]